MQIAIMLPHHQITKTHYRKKKRKKEPEPINKMFGDYKPLSEKIQRLKTYWILTKNMNNNRKQRTDLALGIVNFRLVSQQLFSMWMISVNKRQNKEEKCIYITYLNGSDFRHKKKIKVNRYKQFPFAQWCKRGKMVAKIPCYWCYLPQKLMQPNQILTEMLYNPLACPQTQPIQQPNIQILLAQ